MMLGLDDDAHLLERQYHLSTQILEGIGGGYWEVALFKSWLISEIGFLFTTAVPAALDRVDEVIPAVLMEIVADIIEDEEFEFRAEIGGIGEPGLAEERLGLLGNIAWITRIAFTRDRVQHIADHGQGGDFGKGIHIGAARIRDHQHIAQVDRLPSPDARAIEAIAIF